MKKLLSMALVVVAIFSMMTSCNNMKQIKHLPYPAAERMDVVDNYFGTEVADPYRWLEDDNSEATAEWVKAQNEVTFDYLSQIPFREQIKELIRTRTKHQPDSGREA